MTTNNTCLAVLLGSKVSQRMKAWLALSEAERCCRTTSNAEIRDDISPQALRRLVRRKRDPRASARIFAIANALEGMSRAEAARLLSAYMKR